MDLARFHPAVAGWFAKTLGAPTEPQALGWPAILDGRHTLIAAPTGSGKTLAAFLAAIDGLVAQGLAGPLESATQVLYVSPLKALSNDIQRNLQEPLQGIQDELEAMGLPRVDIRTMLRTGDTPARERTAMIRRPPHILVTTPESLYILLTSEGGRRMLRTVRTVIVDEIHALVRDKRGSHLALSLERLRALTGPGLVRIGLSATQKPIAEVARFLVGTHGLDAAGAADCALVDVGHRRALDLAIELPGSPLEAVMPLEVWGEVFDRVAEMIRAHTTTLVFVNTRRMAERVARQLSDRIGEQHVTSHHGSMSKEHRLTAERRLKAGELKALVATASLELGIDIGAVDLVCQLGSPRSIAAFLQRVGRSGHNLGMVPKGRLFPASRDDLVECAALLDACGRGELDALTIPEKPMDILAQQVVAAVACEEWKEDELYDLVRGAHPYRGLTWQEFTQVTRMLADGFATGRGRRGAHLHRDAVNGRLRARRGARLAAITSGGAIPDTADYEVLLEPGNLRVGTLNEDFAIESMAGDIFQLGNTSWRILRVEPGKVRVEDARGMPPTIPFWLGEAPGRTHELSFSVSRLREEVGSRLPPVTPGFNGSAAAQGAREAEGPDFGEEALAPALQWLAGQVGLAPEAARQVVEYLAAGQAMLGAMPSQNTLVAERFFDESGGMQLVLHAPFGIRLNRAWGLALRKRFCRKFNFELQAAASDDAIVLSLGATHSFALGDVFRYLHSASVRNLLVQAMLDAPMFTTRWRWNAARALAILRWRGGRKVPAQLQRMQAEDLIAVCFPDQLACFENIAGDREIPDHPLVNQTIADCLDEAMDITALEGLLSAMERGEKTFVARDLSEPSLLAQEILNAKPYAFLDDAPLEERRTQAVIARRWMDPQTAADLGALDLAAVERVRDEAWPTAANPDELHDALVLLGFLTDAEGRAGGGRHASGGTGGAGSAAVMPLPGLGAAVAPSGLGPAGEGGQWPALLDALIAERRATRLHPPGAPAPLWVAAERLPELQALFPGARLEPVIAAPPDHAKEWEREAALVELLRGRLEGLGPVGQGALAAALGLEDRPVIAALIALEGQGFVMRGSFTPGVEETEWCERRLLARVHRYTLNRLRKEIEPVSSRDFMRFLLAWQKVEPEQRAEGQEGLAAVLDQLEGFELAAAAWEEEILPARVSHYDPAWLDALCLSGRQAWARLTGPGFAVRGRRGWSPVRATPMALIGRKNLAAWLEVSERAEAQEIPLSSPAAAVRDVLAGQGASFYGDIAEATRLLPSQVEAALAELAALGLVTADSFAGLRALLVPANRRGTSFRGRRRRNQGTTALEGAGRWVLLKKPAPPAEQGTSPETGGAPAPGAPLPPATPPPAAAHSSAGDGGWEPAVERVARALLRRYGVVFRRVLERESALPPWRDLLRVYRRLEARGDIRGGRFVDGYAGEQYALPEAVAMLRAQRRKNRGDGGSGTMLALSAADPLNLVGILTPGGRLPAIAANRVLLHDGEPVAVREGGKVRFLTDLSDELQWQVQHALFRRAAPIPLDAFRRRLSGAPPSQ